MVAQADVLLPGYYCQGDVVLFSGLDLTAGSYWLTFEIPEGGSLSRVSVGACGRCNETRASYLGWVTLSGGEGSFAPGISIMGSNPPSDDEIPEFSVSAVPEPSQGAALLGSRHSFMRRPE